MIKSGSNSSDEVRLTPLPFVTPPAAPRQSIALRLQGSSYLFPKTSSSPKMMSDVNSNIDDACDGRIENSNCDIKGVNGQSTNKKQINIIVKPCISSKLLRPNEKGNKNGGKPYWKSVRFDAEVNSYQLDTPCASDMSSKEKSARWYGATEFDQFKYEAAKNAGVKIVRYDSDKVGQSHHFAMMGDFDFKTGTPTENDGVGTANAVEKPCYNENEYKDTRSSNGDGEAICKRGLGYHFSRSRKKSRMVTRSAVMAWQTTLKDPANENNSKFQESLPSLGFESATKSEKNSGRNSRKYNSGMMTKTGAMLALVSAKCSRVAWMEAKWRGEVDYRVAHPERHVSAPTEVESSSSSPSPVNVCKESSSSVNAEMGKRDGEGIFFGMNNAKRRRIGRCRGVGHGTSPPTIGCVSGMLQAEV